MGELKLTEQQHAAVFDRGGSLLVSAAAGSGKTKVLVERVFSYLTQERANVDDFLIITYTRAAAAELRAWIRTAIRSRLRATRYWTFWSTARPRALLRAMTTAVPWR